MTDLFIHAVFPARACLILGMLKSARSYRVRDQGTSKSRTDVFEPFPEIAQNKRENFDRKYSNIAHFVSLSDQNHVVRLQQTILRASNEEKVLKT